MFNSWKDLYGYGLKVKVAGIISQLLTLQISSWFALMSVRLEYSLTTTILIDDECPYEAVCITDQCDIHR